MFFGVGNEIVARKTFVNIVDIHLCKNDVNSYIFILKFETYTFSKSIIGNHLKSSSKYLFTKLFSVNTINYH